MTSWEYRILSLPRFADPTVSSEPSAAVAMLNEQGASGWEAVGMLLLENGSVAVLVKRPSTSQPRDGR